MSVTKSRPAFAMIMAIFVVLLVAAGGVLLLGNVSLGTNQSSRTYILAQEQLLAESATEYAVMRAQGFDTTLGSCLNKVNIRVKDSNGSEAYDVNVTLQYSFKGPRPNNVCNRLTENTGTDTMILVDTTVTTSLSQDEVRVQKRSWQKL